MNHDRYGDDYIRAILAGVKTVAVVGASTNPARASNIVVKYLLGKKYRAYPVNPVYAGQKILGQMCYARLADVPEPIDARRHLSPSRRRAGRWSTRRSRSTRSRR